MKSAASFRSLTMPILVVLVSVVLTGVASFLSYRAARDGNDMRFQSAAGAKVDAIERKLTFVMAKNQALTSLFQAGDSVSWQTFKTFAAAVMEQEPSIQALEWVPIVDHIHRQAYEQSSIKEQFPSFSFTEKTKAGQFSPRKDVDTYYPVYYLCPIVGNEQAVGYDLGSDEFRLRALEAARTLRKPVSTPRVTLVQEKGQSSGFLVFDPVIKNDEVVGFALLVLRLDALIESSLASFAMRGFQMVVTDAKNGDLLGKYIHGKPFKGKSMTNPAHTLTREIEVAGRTWQIKLSSDGDKLGVAPWSVALVVGILGLLIGLLLARVVYQSFKREMSIQLRVNDQTKALTAALDEIKKSEQQLLLRTKELEQLNDSLDAFSYRASHDLKSPVTNLESMLTMLKSLVKFEPGSMEAQVIDNMDQAVVKFKATIADFLELSRMQRVPVSKAEFIDLNSLMEEVISDYSNEIEGAKAKILVDFSKLEQVHCSRTVIKSVCANLLSNAVKYRHPDRPCQVHITSGQNDHQYFVRVADNGMGIDLDAHGNKLFQMFSRLENSQQQEGTGVGLYMIRKIMVDQGGGIDVESTLGKGSAFTAWWPLK